MTKHCPYCGVPLIDGDRVIAAVKTTYRQLPSRIAFAVTTPTECIEIQHEDCWKGVMHEYQGS